MPSTSNEDIVNYYSVCNAPWLLYLYRDAAGHTTPTQYSSSRDHPQQEQKQCLQHLWSGHINLLTCPNIIRLFHRIDTSSNMSAIMEHMQQGEFWWASRGVLGSIHQEEQTAHIFWQTVLTANHLHQSKIAHKNIKLKNILVDDMRHAKFCDFRLATKVTPEQRLREACGTLRYIALRVLLGRCYDSLTSRHLV